MPGIGRSASRKTSLNPQVVNFLFVEVIGWQKCNLTILYSQSVAALCLDFLKLGSIEKLYKKLRRTAQALVNKEVREQHPGSVSDDLLRKKKEWALKIYNLFSEIVVRISCRIFIYVSRNIILNTSSSFVSITGSFGVEDSTGMAGM
ncbi:unnamed protein product [Rhizophagus irregularis]|nr:unnamed protein product [Rhizophagus irregularis]